VALELAEALALDRIRPAAPEQRPVEQIDSLDESAGCGRGGLAKALHVGQLGH
jgi:hypothetical protein